MIVSDELPLRSELFSADQMEQHGKFLADLHRIKVGRTSDRLLQRLSENEAVLNEACSLLTKAINADRRITPAGEWLLDNFYLIEEQIRTAKRHLPKGYSRQLPKLVDGPSAGLPRVYDIALAIISHGDGRVDPEILSRFVSSYQRVTELKLGELWAIPIMLRLALIENLRRVALRMKAGMVERDLAGFWADKMIDVALNDPTNLILVIADMARSHPPMVSSFVAELARRLQGQSSALALGLTWIEQRLAETGSTIEQLVQAETQLQAADQLSISNSIGSLRFLGSMDWRKFVESQSVIEHILSEDPQHAYSKMDFATRDHYRHVVEKIATKSSMLEGEIARAVIKLASEGNETNGNQDRSKHVGFYLIDDGLTQLEKLASARNSIWSFAKKAPPLFSYLIPIALVTLILSWCLIESAYKDNLPVWLLSLVACVCVVSVSQLAVSLVNWLATLVAASEPIPKMDFSEGIPVENATMVVVPTMITTPGSINDLVEALEVRFLANRDEHLYFALLTDFFDADSETLPEDRMLLELAEDKIRELNHKYPNGTDKFFLFHRPRIWNANERIWMGYERKRGKLSDLNAFLRGNNHNERAECPRFSLVVGDLKALPEIKYVITLDTDTQLPRDTAQQFIGAMAHPLNRPHYDDNKERVVAGYGILQPRVGVSLPGTNRSRYAALNGNEPGIDPYTRTVSDVYQDIFREGSFIGKGIYDVDAFEQALKDRFPENRILSHDLLEGCYVRSGLLTDVQLYEEYPATYLADVSRRHRWIRGDWQIASWLLPNVSNALPLLSLWKIFDNLRRSLVTPALAAMFILGWTVLQPSWLWTLAALAIIFVPPLIFSILDLVRKPEDTLWQQHVADTTNSAIRHLFQSCFTLACLPFEAVFSLDAILRTIYRITISKRNLLAWNPSDSLFHRNGRRLIDLCLQMAGAPLIAVSTGIYLLTARPEALVFAFPILTLWFFSPLIAWWISRPVIPREALLTYDQVLFLRKIARRTWAFFDTFVATDDNHLPPDNVQELPIAGVAHRTSPTNMGLSLLANLSAYDFGYIQVSELVERTYNTLTTMHRLERHRGHLYNWYDTLTLRPLPPRYVSTVDSGNLAGHLLTLSAGLTAIIDESIISNSIFDGMQDTLGILSESLGETTLPELTVVAYQIKNAQLAIPANLAAMHSCLAGLTESTAQLASVLEKNQARYLLQDACDPTSQIGYWAYALSQQTSLALDELVYLAPWITLPGVYDAEMETARLDSAPTLREIAGIYSQASSDVQQDYDLVATPEKNRRQVELLVLMSEASRRAKEKIAAIEQLISLANDLADIEYEFLYDKSKRLLAIGYNAEDRRTDLSFYDLLASEARLCNFVAIAQGKLPQESWFALGRSLTIAAGEPVLFSWSGSMFEYLMPLLVMPTYANTLLDQTYQAAIAAQIEYGKQRKIPWGISESGYYAVDIHLNYQYRAFGVPGLGLKRGLAQDLVIAPYATALGLMVAPEASCHNLERLAGEGFVGKYGFYEAVDYTTSRLPRGQNHAVVRSFMAHHQGMTLLSLAYCLLDKPMQKRFESDQTFKATMLLLQERIPKAGAFQLQSVEASTLEARSSNDEAPVRYFQSADTKHPEIQLLSNGKYHVMMTNAGGGYSKWKDMAVTRWHADSTCDNWGSFCYIQDRSNGEFWSNAHQPTLKKADSYEAIFSEARVEYRRRDKDIDTHTEIVVSSEDDIEVRRVRLTNRSRQRKQIDITSYAEVVLTNAINDSLHPAFSNLFVETEIIEESQAIVCHRRPRSEDEQPPWMFHLMSVHGASSGIVSYETDRMKFIGRGNSISDPQAMHQPSLSGSQGSVLDPIVAVRHQLTINPEESITVNIVTGITESRDACFALIDKYQDRRLTDRVFDIAWTHSQVVLRQLNATESDGQLYARLANSIIYANSTLRADAGILMKNRRGQSDLWGYAISGDLPIVLLQISNLENIELVRQLVQAHAYWRLKGLVVDLVIWNEDKAGYRQVIQDQIMGLIASGVEANLMDKPGGIFVRPGEQISPEDRILFQSVARAIIKDTRGSLAEQIMPRKSRDTKIPRLLPNRLYRRELPAVPPPQRSDLILFNGLGGFTSDGREYVISTVPDNVTPAPWVNVLANQYFGTVISENGVGYTWLENAHEFRLTPWNNDPVTDAAGEAFYIRDEETGHFWSPSPLPARGATPYLSRHGFGYSVFEHTEDGITSELWIYVALDAPVKIAALKIRNHSGRSRRLSATAYVEWVLGDLRAKTAMHVVTELDRKTGALFARNSYNTEFGGRVAFLDVDETSRSLTGDRTEFLGRNGTLTNPDAMTRVNLSGKVGAGLDPCAALQVPFELGDGQEREIVFRLGIGQTAEDATTLVNRFRGSIARRETFNSLCHYWNHTLGTVNVQTPDPSINMLVNGWLLYQTIACRLWARSGYYQSGGAFGFRDQLQDTMALIHAEPRLLRKQLLLCASRQFVEGDVQHWWHPPSGRGVRTHISDDFLWLPLATCRYVLSTGDTGVLDEQTHFLTGRPVNPQDDSYYDLPGRSAESKTLYEHCKLAIINGLQYGVHGLPLMGGGDWNDGMNLVGERGAGESVWLAFFLYEVLRQFTEVSRLYGDNEFVARLTSEAKMIRRNIAKHGWDGAWYRRAYFDDGRPLGSASNSECRIDSISQSWSVLSGAGEKEKTQQAMNSLDQWLVKREHALVQLLDPPFDKSDLNPGYIKGYVPGVRENGGQYTHAAIWATMAFAALGDNKRAWELFNMINPVNHARTKEETQIYKVEPYVVAADVYAVDPHIGRGGWTWYTGSASWMYRLITESLLGIRLDVDKLSFSPCLPPEWPEYKVHYRFHETVYHITVLQSPENARKQSVIIDNVPQREPIIHLVDDRREHFVEVRV